MIAYVEGNLFESPAAVLVNTVNTVGVMGKGVASTFRSLYPKMYSEYRALCETGAISIGTLWLYRTANKSVLNFPTKMHWRNPSKPEYIEEGLRTFVRTYQAAGISSIAFPALGCGNGGLSFERQVRPLMERYLKNTKAHVFVYPHRTSMGMPEHKNIHDMASWLRSTPEDLSFLEVWEELVGVIGDELVAVTGDGRMTFRYNVLSDPLGITIRGPDTEYHVLFEQLLDVWQELRSVGFTNARLSATSSSVVARAIQTLFSRLPYVHPVRLAPEYENEMTFREVAQFGIQFTPRSAPVESQLSLLAAT